MKRHNSLLLLIAIFISSCSTSGTVFKNAICIQNINTIDPEDGLKENQTVVIQDGKILQISTTDDLLLSPTNKIIDGSGKYMIPGLWDAHVHFSFLEELAPYMFDLFLVYGITSVRDTGGRIEFVKEWKDKSEVDPTAAPRVMIAGPLLDGMPNVYDGSDAGHPPLSVGLKTVNDVDQYIDYLDSMGVDFLKAYEMLTPEQFSMVTERAKEKGFKVTGHVPLSMNVTEASNAGLNSMEHLRNLELSCASNANELHKQRRQLLKDGSYDPGGILRSRIHQAQRQNAIENYSPEKADEVLAVLARNQTWQIPTMALNTSFVTKPYMIPNWQESFTYLPDTIRNQWNTIIETVMNSEASSFRKEYAQWMKNMVGKIHEADIGIMAGTDTPIGFLTPGFSLHEELVVLVSSGISTLDALKTATINPAKYFNLDNELGSIKENMWADLLILNSNPVDDINNTKDINTVIRQGKVYNRDDLDKILDRLENN